MLLGVTDHPCGVPLLPQEHVSALASKAGASSGTTRRASCRVEAIGPAAARVVADTLAPSEMGGVEPYRAAANAVRESARSHYTDGLRALEQLGAGERLDPQRLVTTFAALLRRAKLEGVGAERDVTERVLALLGVEDWNQQSRVAQVQRVMNALGEAPDIHDASYETTLLARYLLRQAARTRQRWQARAAELSTPSPRRPHDDLFFTLAEFPNLAQEAYRALQVEGLEDFPPRQCPGVPMNAKAERLVGLVTAWQREHRTAARVEAGLLIGGAILVGIAGSVLVGPGGGVLGASVVGIGGTAARVGREARVFASTQDAYRLGLGSAEAVAFQADELEGARGALLVSLATAGIVSRLGVPTVSGSLVKQLLMRQGRSLAIGTSAGAAIALVHPRTWKTPDTMGAIVDGVALGAASGVVGGLFGAAAGASTRVAITFVSKPSVPISNESVHLRLNGGPEIAARVVSLLPQLGILTAKAADGSTLQVRIESLTMLQVPTPKLEALGLLPAAMTMSSNAEAPAVGRGPNRARARRRRRRVRKSRRSTRKRPPNRVKRRARRVRRRKASLWRRSP